MTTMTLKIPNNDISMFKLIVERMGWLLQQEATEQPTFTRAEVEAAKKRGKMMRQFIEKFRTDEISEEEIREECEAVRQEMYEKRLQAR
jgi:hypothetical protein